MSLAWATICPCDITHLNIHETYNDMIKVYSETHLHIWKRIIILHRCFIFFLYDYGVSVGMRISERSTLGPKTLFKIKGVRTIVNMVIEYEK